MVGGEVSGSLIGKSRTLSELLVRILSVVMSIFCVGGSSMVASTSSSSPLNRFSQPDKIFCFMSVVFNGSREIFVMTNLSYSLVITVLADSNTSPTLSISAVGLKWCVEVLICRREKG